MQAEEEELRKQNHDEEEREGAGTNQLDHVSGYETLDPNRIGN